MHGLHSRRSISFTKAKTFGIVSIFPGRHCPDERKGYPISWVEVKVYHTYPERFGYPHHMLDTSEPREGIKMNICQN